MKTEKVIVNFSADKLQAIRVLKPEIYETIEKMLTDSLERLYVRSVPHSTRLYIEAKINDDENQEKKPTKPEEKQVG